MRISVLQQQEQPEELEVVLRPQDVADSIHYLAHVGDARPTTSFCWMRSMTNTNFSGKAGRVSSREALTPSAGVFWHETLLQYSVAIAPGLL